MTKVEKPCIRGCTRRCNCVECADQPTHDPIPKPQGDGLLCLSCEKRLSKWLIEIPDMYATLDPRIGTGERGEQGKHRKVSGSPALARLDILAMQDPRTRVGVEMSGRWDAQGRQIVEDEEFQHYEETVHIPTVVLQWALILVEELGLSSEPADMATGIGIMRAWWGELIKQPWVDEFYDDMRVLRSRLGSAHGEQRPRPVGSCIRILEIPTDDPKKPRYRECGASLYAPESGAKVRCNACGGVYDGMDLLRLKIQTIREGRVV